MKKNRIIILVTLLTMTIFTFFIFNNNLKQEKINDKNQIEDNIDEKDIIEDKKEIQKTNLVSYNGWLNIENNTLVNEKHEKIMLKGLSTHGIQWYADLASYSIIKSLRDDWHSNLFRVAMYTEENGYIENRELKQKLIEIVDNVIKLDMYVIIDWHILSDGDPLKYKEEAKEFFDEISNRYKDYPNVIYEICNEPNGNITWDDNIKPYALEVIDVIRKNSKNSIIIVGTGTWSQDVDKASKNKIDDNLVMYALHFYSGTHTEWLRNRALSVLNEIPIFVSEWGVSDNYGNNGVYLEEAEKWINFMNENNISWANWSLSNKDESSALFNPNSDIKELKDEYLSLSGQFVKKVMLQ